MLNDAQYYRNNNTTTTLEWLLSASTGILRNPKAPKLPSCSSPSWKSGLFFAFHLLYPTSKGYLALLSLFYMLCHVLGSQPAFPPQSQNATVATGCDFVIACAILVDPFLLLNTHHSPCIQVMSPRPRLTLSFTDFGLLVTSSIS